MATGLMFAAVIAGLLVAEQPGSAQRARVDFPRMSNGKPNLNGIWQALSSAHWDLLDHSAKPSPVVSMGAFGAIPPGAGVVEGGEIPYTPAATKQQQENAANWLMRDPAVKCFYPGVPRATYMPYPFQILQGPGDILLAYQFAEASRQIFMGFREDLPEETWMGVSRGKWEGDTLVVDVKGFNDQTWFDAAGNFHSEQLHVVERYTPIDRDHLMYEATIEDPKVFTRPWKIRLPLYRRIEPRVDLLEFKCVEFVEELMYGHLRKKTN